MLQLRQGLGQPGHFNLGGLRLGLGGGQLSLQILNEVIHDGAHQSGRLRNAVKKAVHALIVTI